MKTEPKSLISAAAIAFTAALAATLSAQTEAETTVFHGGTILTIDEAFSEAEALAIRGNKILAVGAEADVLKAAGEDAKSIDLGGKVVLPAFIDAHFHVLGTAQYSVFESVGLLRFKSVDEALAHMKKTAEAEKDSGWHLFSDIDLSTQSWDKKSLTQADLDAISTTNPVFVWHAGGHVATVNSKLQELLGELELKDGNVYGGDILEVLEKIEPYKSWEPVEGLRAAHPQWLAMGLGTLGDTGTGPVTGGPGDFDALLKASENGALPQRVRCYMSNFVEEAWRKRNPKPGEGNGQIKLIGYKLSADGSNQAQTGLQRKPYQGSEDRGKAYLAQEQLNRQVAEWSKKGFQIAIHGNGGAAIDNIITGVRAARAQGIGVKRPRIEHCSIVHNDQLISFAELGLSGSFLIGHVRYWGGAMVKVLGEDRARLLDRTRTFEKMKIPFSLHSDSPVIATGPLEMIEIAVNRDVVTRPGYVLSPDEKISVEMAIRAVTSVPAWQMFSEGELGSLEAGKLADLVFLASDPRKVEPENIAEIKVLETWIDGKRVFELKQKQQ